MFDFFDPIVRGPLFGSALMSCASALMGVFLFVRKQSLLGETLSHATYPGIIVGAFFSVFFDFENALPFFILGGGFLSAFLATFLLKKLQKKRNIKSDSALTLILTTFFGFGTLLASVLQSLHPKELKSIQGYLYGQAATMTDFHIALYGGLTAFVVFVLFLFFKELKLLAFDPKFFQTTRGKLQAIDTLFIFLTVLGVVIGMRSVGIILMSAMLIAPAVSARQFTDKLVVMLLIAGSVALFSSFFGTLISFSLSLPTGPVIVLFTAAIALFSLLFAPKRGLSIRYVRMYHFRWICLSENFLKLIWRERKGKFSDFKEKLSLSRIQLFLLLHIFKRRGWIEKKKGVYSLSQAGEMQGSRIVRLHRLWEVYLATYLGVGVERVHKSAEEMEHILTPELERELTLLLKDPQHDPHDQPIPPGSIAYG